MTLFMFLAPLDLQLDIKLLMIIDSGLSIPNKALSI